MSSARRTVFKMLGLTLALASLGLPAQATDAAGFGAGKVFTSSNATAGNELLVYSAADDGALTLQTRLPTQGLGTGGGLGNQGAVTLSGDGRFVFVVNASSHSVSTFRIGGDGVTLVSTVDSGGLRPISVAEHDGLVYVLNADGAGNVAGFRNRNGMLEAMADSVRPLSADTGTDSAQVGFGAGGKSLFVTEKGTNKITSYRVRQNGTIGGAVVTASAGATPFGFAVDKRGHLLVSEAFGGAPGASALSSYGFRPAAPARPVVVSASVGTTQSAACWVVVTPDGRHAYTTNTASGTISLYDVQQGGVLSLAQGVAATSDAGPIDAALGPRGRRLYVLNAGSDSITAYRVAGDGTLQATGSVNGVPDGATGLAAN